MKEIRTVGASGQGWGRWGLTGKKHKEASGGDRNVLYHDSSEGYKAICIGYNPATITLRSVHLTVCHYISKAMF